MQATSQALQPMQVVVSISLATSRSRFKPEPGTVPAWPEIRRTSRLVWVWLMAFPLGLLELDQEALELGRVGVGIEDGRRQPVEQRLVVPPFVLGDTAETLMDRNADLVHLLAVDHHRLDAFGDESLGEVVTSGARHLDLVTSLDPQGLRELDRHLDERLGDELHV